MTIIKGFSTKKDILAQLKAAGVVVQLPFTASLEFKTTKNPFKDILTKSADGKVQKIVLGEISKDIIDPNGW